MPQKSPKTSSSKLKEHRLPLIAVTGYKGSGKSTIAEYLNEKGYTRVGFADPLKAMLKAIGLEESHLYGERKHEALYILCNMTPRHAMQTLGTEWGRDLIHPDLWTTLWWGRVRHILALKGKVVCDDLRFMNEAGIVAEKGGVIWRVYRDETTPLEPEHESEYQIKNIMVDVTLSNNGTIERLKEEVDKILSPESPVPRKFDKVLGLFKK